MSIESETRAFTRTGKAWTILLLAFISWVVICLWSFKVSGYSLAGLVAEPDVGSASQDLAENAATTVRIAAEENTHDSDNVKEPVIESDSEIEDLAEVDRDRFRISAEEKIRLTEQQAAAETLNLEEEAEAEAALLAEQQAAAEALLLEQEAEAARLAEQQAAAEALRLEQEAEAEAARLAEQQAAAEAVRLEQEAEAARLLAIAEEASSQAEEQTRREQEQRALELQAAADAAEQARLAVVEQSEATSEVLDASGELLVREAQPVSPESDQSDSDTSPASAGQAPDLYEGEVVVLEPETFPSTSIEVAAVETETVRSSAPSRLRQGAAAQRRASFIQLREQELNVLAGQSARILFDPESSVITRELERPLDRIFEPLFLYAETQVVITVSGNEYAGELLDSELSLSRGAAIVEYLVSRGLDQERFTIQIESGEDLQLDTHRVRISAEEPIR